jgi:hypothetical protein
MATARYNPPPNWPTPPDGWTPPPGWQPDPSWGPAPEGWQVWLTDKPNENWFSRHKVLTAIGAVVLALTIIGAFVGSGKTSPADENSASATSEGPSEAEKSADAARIAANEAAASAQAEADRVAAEQEAQARAAEEAARMDPASYAVIASRDYALIAKDPDLHAGEKYVLYGHITQFDSATGPDAFLANTDAVEHSEWYEYDVNTLVGAEDPTILAPVVEDDLVKMYVEVVGSFSYDTQIGGNTTVPQVTVRMIEVIGSSN